MTEQEAMNKVQELVTLRRKNVGLGRSYCTICHNPDARYVSSDLMTGRTECEECFAKRIYKALESNITESDTTEVKEQRAQFVKEYFTKRKHQINN